MNFDLHSSQRDNAMVPAVPTLTSSLVTAFEKHPTASQIALVVIERAISTRREGVQVRIVLHYF
jgi:hypothetical protein